jgi:hypothetical protein
MLNRFEELGLPKSSYPNFEELSEFDQETWFIEVGRLKDGESFGELALLDDAPRAATITCIEKTTVIILERKDYERVLQKIEKKEIEGKLNCIKQLPFLTHFGNNSLVKISYLFH